jgi:hypothetical protein
MWQVVAAYAGERSVFIKFNWSFLRAGVVLPKLHHYFVELSSWLQFTVYKLGSNKNKYVMYVKQIIMFSGLGKESGWRGSSLEKNQLIYNPTSIFLPINLQTPQTYTFKFI